jgi:hypothetical protein
MRPYERQIEMLIDIIFAVFGILTGFIAARAKYRSTIVELAESLNEKDNETYMNGYRRGWEMASNDFFNVKTSWQRLTNPEN